MSNLERTAAFLKSLETRDGSSVTYYAPDVVQREFPNQPSTLVRNDPGLLVKNDPVGSRASRWDKSECKRG